MNQEELEEFAQFLKMAEVAGGAGYDSASEGMNEMMQAQQNEFFFPGLTQKRTPEQQKIPSWFSTFNGHLFLGVSIFTSSIIVFRNFGHLLD